MGFLSKIGNVLNDITGTTSAAKLQNKYQKEFAQNAHQWEMQDLKKAGLNPILTATGGSGANAGGAGGTTGSAGVNPIESVINTINGVQTAKKTASENENIQAQTLATQTETIGKGIMNKIAEIDLAYRDEKNQTKINKLKGELKTLQAQYNKIIEETNRIKGGTFSDTLGTWINHMFDGETDKGKDPNKPNLFSNRSSDKPIRFW